MEEENITKENSDVEESKETNEEDKSSVKEESKETNEEDKSNSEEIKETTEEVSNIEENKEEKVKEDYIKVKKSTLRNAVIFLGILALIVICVFAYGKFKGPTGAVVGVDNESSDVDEGPDTQSEGVKLTVLNDKRCKDCDARGSVSRLREVFPNLEVKELDYSSKEGKELYETVRGSLPALLFDNSVTKSEGYSQIQRYLEKKGDYLSLKIGATHDPTKEICDNKVDDTGDGKVDCEDDDCSSKLICNKDAFAECASSYDITPETVIFYYSNNCGWCTKMKPGVTQLQEEGYEFKWVEAGNAEEEQVVNDCFREYMGGGVPQFICPKTANIKGGAFTDADANLNIEAMKKFADECIAG